MAKDPAFLFYSSDFLVGTYTMTDEQVGQYVRLLCLQHQQGHLTEATMRSGMRGQLDSAVIGKFKRDKDGLFYNVRLDEEATKRKEYSDSRRGNLSNAPNHKKHHMMHHMIHHMENENVIVNEDVIDTVTDTVNSNRNSIPPSLKDVRAYCIARGNSVDPVKFINYYETRGWMLGKVKMKNWHAAIHTWEGNNYSNSSATDESINWAIDRKEGDQ